MTHSAPYRLPLLRRPNAAGGSNNTPGRCPFVGTPADPGTSLAFPSEANHCFRSRLPIPISSIHQENYCLSAHYETCPVYRQYATEDGGAELAAPVPVVVAAPEPARRPGEGITAAPTAAAVAAAAAAWAADRDALAAPPGDSIFPDFQPDFGPEPVLEPEPRVAREKGRTILIGAAVLAVLALAGWFALTLLESRDNAATMQGTVVTLPTLPATVDFGEGDGTGSNIAVGAAAEATATALAATERDASATPETTSGQALTGEATSGAVEIDSVAATATALFAGVVATVECRAPDWWVPYVTLEGDTIEALAAARGILPEELIVANCLAEPALAPGIELRLPPVGVIVLLPGAAATLIAPTATFPAGLPTRRPPILFPTPTFPALAIPTARPPELEPGEPEPDQPRPTAPPVLPIPTVTPPSLPPTSTPPFFGATSTPPGVATAPATKTPPGSGGGITPTVTGTVAPTSTPPTP